ncbi:MAG: hypothetical protein Q4C70_02725, partial [Planctomycetia bacterium]|nr:hypothetical protein [Planctomycetia bacterium]
LSQNQVLSQNSAHSQAQFRAVPAQVGRRVGTSVQVTSDENVSSIPTQRGEASNVVPYTPASRASRTSHTSPVPYRLSSPRR